MHKNFGEAIAATGILEVKTAEEVKQEIAEWLGLVGVTEIADRAGVATNTVAMWQRRHGDFPEPIAELAQGKVWAWRDVQPWVERQKAKGPGRPKKSD